MIFGRKKERKKADKGESMGGSLSLQKEKIDLELMKLEERRRNGENEDCFLEERQKIKYHSFIILELVPLETFDSFFKGLQKIYKNCKDFQRRLEEYKRDIYGENNKLFQRCSCFLPQILNKNIGESFIPDSTFHDLGKNINSYYIEIHKILPSALVVQIHAYLDEKVSDRMNNILYKYHKERRTQFSRGFRITPANIVKEEEIYKFMENIRSEAIDFLSKYFKGIFFESIEERGGSIVPHFDIFSLKYPTEKEEILEWGKRNSGFFNCFNTYISSNSTYIYRNLLLLFGSKEYGKFDDYFIFINRKFPNDEYSIDTEREELFNIGLIDFSLFAIERWLKLQEEFVISFTRKLSDLAENLNKNKINKVIDSRKYIIEKIIHFKRFKIEFSNFSSSYYRMGFIRMNNGKKSESDLGEVMKKDILRKMNQIDDLIKEYDTQFEIILNLKNIEFNKRMQNIVLWVTVVMTVLVAIQLLIICLR